MKIDSDVVRFEMCARDDGGILQAFDYARTGVSQKHELRDATR